DVVASPAALVSGSCTDTLEYPASALDSRHEGTVHMLVSIDEEGRVLQAKLTEHVGFGLDEAALTAVKSRCRFTPARDADGNPVPALIEHLFVFHLIETAANGQSGH
ncbi:MAG TPA: energy transducer TonB, partial [Polyangia bacterium]|nr:energy transducer TonB [Polyangia bacterium]